MTERAQDRTPQAGRWSKITSVGVGLLLGALTGIVVGLVAGVGIAVILGIL